MPAVSVPVLIVPPEVLDKPLVVSISGGKDSTAAALALREAGLSFRLVFADTGWEAPETYAHLDHLRDRLGPIHVVARPGGMLAQARAYAAFASRTQRWCTRTLKLKPIKTYLDELADMLGPVVSVVGVRAEESEARAKLRELEDDDTLDAWIWRPILRWSVADVLAIHHRHGVEVNPLYRRGHDRVGCYPCIFASKGDLRLVAEHAPERIEEIRAAEAELTALRVEQGKEGPATFFGSRAGGGGAIAIDEAVSWARTSRGGRQLPLIAPPPDGGCFRWGLCEPPGKEDGDA